MKKHIASTLLGLCAVVLVYFIATTVAMVINRLVFDEPCWTGKTKPCVFGPGIPGTKTCDGFSEWKECVPECTKNKQ